MDNIFYTYIYLDPRKPGTYQYGDYKFDFEPFYVGKGFGYQSNTHLYQARYNNANVLKINNKHKYYKIKNILKENLQPIIFKIEDNLPEQEAFLYEIFFIWSIGRSDLKLGPLTNHTDGGEGSVGAKRIISKETRKKISETLKGVNHPNYGKHHSEETRKKISESLKGNPNLRKSPSEESKRKMSNSHLGKLKPEEVKKKISLSKLGKNHTEETKQKIGKSNKKIHRMKLKEKELNHEQVISIQKRLY